MLLLKRLFSVSEIVSLMLLPVLRLCALFDICSVSLSKFTKIGINYTNPTILGSWDFLNFILVDEPFIKLYWILKIVHHLIITYMENQFPS